MTAIEREPLAYRIEEAAKRIGVSRATFYRFIAAGRLKTVKIGRIRLISARALDALIENVPTRRPTKVPTNREMIRDFQRRYETTRD
jgi:excisionase family DNA binding protein